MNKKGFSLMELMTVVAITGVVSLFSFESVRQVIKASIGVQKKENFNGIIEELTLISNHLDQCTCNFRNMTFNVAPSINVLTLNNSSNGIYRFSNTQGPPECQGPEEIILSGSDKYSVSIERVELHNIQFLASMFLLRASLYVQGRIASDNNKVVRRSIPLMFSTALDGSRRILGCIGMTQ